MQQQIIHLKGLDIGYQQKGNAVSVAKSISASLQSGELTCLLGANGVGKSTLLRTLAAFLPTLGGNVMLSGRPIADYSQRALSRQISVVLTDKPTVRDMTVSDLVGLGRTPYTGFWGTLSAYDRNIVAETLQLVGISHLANRRIETLSDGERQKTMIAKALAQQTPIILLDEPTAFLDFPSKVEMMQLLRHLAVSMNKTIFMSTHDVELALQIASRLWLMQKGEPMLIGTPQELAATGALSKFIERDGIILDKDSLTIRVGK